MLLVHVLVRDVHVIHRRVVVLVRVSGEQVPPVLSLVQVVRDVIVLVAVPQGLMLVMSLLPRHYLSPLPARVSTVYRAVYLDRMGPNKQETEPRHLAHRIRGEEEWGRNCIRCAQ